MPPSDKMAAALQDELGAVSAYADMAAEITDPTIRGLVMSIMGDEYGHARTFAMMLAVPVQS